MPTLYCPFPGCGASITYTASKPATCPKCDNPFAAAFKVEPVITKASTQPVKPKKKRPSWMPKREEVEASEEPTFMMPMDGSDAPLPPKDDAAPEPDTSDEDEDDTEDTDPDQVTQLAQEIAASLNEDDIIVHGLTGDDWGVRIPRPKQ